MRRWVAALQNNLAELHAAAQCLLAWHCVLLCVVVTCIKWEQANVFDSITIQYHHYYYYEAHYSTIQYTTHSVTHTPLSRRYSCFGLAKVDQYSNYKQLSWSVLSLIILNVELTFNERNLWHMLQIQHSFITVALSVCAQLLRHDISLA